MKESQVDIDFVSQQVELYGTIRPIYESFSELLRILLQQQLQYLGVSALVSVRTKGMPNFAEKIIRKSGKYFDPVNQLTDLCGARVILSNLDDIEVVCNCIRQTFVIDESNSEDVVERLGESKFGYRSVHFIVSLPTDAQQRLVLDRDFSLQKSVADNYETLLAVRNIDEAEQSGLPIGPKYKAEIQVRTLIQHAWAEFAHDQIYKSDFEVPQPLQRDANRIAALLEAADQDFAETSRKVAWYNTYLGAYMTTKQMESEIETLRVIARFDSNNLQLIGKTARLAISAGNGQLAREVLGQVVASWEQSPQGELVMQQVAKELQSKTPRMNMTKDRGYDTSMSLLLHDYGWASWNTERDPICIQHILAAMHLDPGNPDILQTLGYVYRKQASSHQAKDLYTRDLKTAEYFFQKAHSADSEDPKALIGMILCRVELGENTDFLQMIEPAIENAIKTCERRAQVGVFLPDAHLLTGFLRLIQGHSFASLNSYLKGVALTHERTEKLEEALQAVEELEAHAGRSNTDFELIKKFLTAAIFAKKYAVQKSGEAIDPDLQELISEISHSPFSSPSKVVFVAGGCDKSFEAEIDFYTKTFPMAFHGFNGTIIAGGTKSGVSGLAGALPENGVKRLAYLPQNIPAGVVVDPNNFSIRTTSGQTFSPLEPVQAWVDLFAAGVAPSDVLVLGINGGSISALEYRIGLAFGAEVGVISTSGKAVRDLVQDPFWSKHNGLLLMPNDPLTLNLFICGASDGSLLSKDIRECLAQDTHQRYLEKQYTSDCTDSSLLPWERLNESLKKSNYQQVDFMGEKLSMVGLTIKPKTGNVAADKSIELSSEQIELMAEKEHARWNLERIRAGWRLGEKDVGEKCSPYLLPWQDLSEDIKQLDRETIHNLPILLESAGFVIVPNQ